MQPRLGLDAITWRRLEPLLDDALDLPPAQRDAWLAALPAQHADLKDRLRELLARAARVESAALLAALPALDTTGDDTPSPPGTGHATGDSIGPYRLLRELGVGGMGAVWLAERTDGLMTQRNVALKLPFGPFRGDLAARIAREREILATLEHPHIARLYDAGVAADGQPFLALEHIDGERIDHYCAQHRLGIRARLELFLQAARAVAHAHAKLVVHRDIKPSNLLVDAGGQVKLLDFGIARLLDDGTASAHELTQQGARPFTPDYAAPEQVSGQPVDTRCDVYALGVLLFELLTGQRPYRVQRDSRAALEEAILKADVPRASDVAVDASTRRALRGDLDTIVLKALKKQPEERYATVDALASDLRRHLAHEPVLARPDSLSYRLRKLLRRRRAAVGAVAAVALALLGGSALAWWQAHEAGLQRDAALAAQVRAEDERTAAQRAERAAVAGSELSGFLMMEMAGALTSDDIAAPLERSRKLFDTQYRDDPALRGRLLLQLGILYNGRADAARAQALWAEAEPLLRTGGEWPALADLLCFRALALARRQSDFVQARSLLAEAAQLQARADARAQVIRRHCLVSQAIVERNAGNTAHAVTLLEQALDEERQAGRAERTTVIDVLNALARAYYDAGRYRDAVRTARAASALTARFGLERTGHQQTARTLEAIALREGGRPLESLAVLDDGGGRAHVRMSERMQYAHTLLRLQRLDAALSLIEELLPAARAQMHSELRALGLAHVQVLTDLGRREQARAALVDVETQYAALRKDKRYPARAFAFTQAHWALAAEDVALAQAALDEARAIVEAAGQADDPAWHQVHQLQARLHLARGQAADALEHAEAALARSQRQAVEPDASFRIAEDLLLRAQARHALDDRAGANADAAAALRHAREAAGAEHPLVHRANAQSLR